MKSKTKTLWTDLMNLTFAFLLKRSTTLSNFTYIGQEKKRDKSPISEMKARHH